MVRQVAKSFTGSHFDDEALFAKIAKEITEQGFSINPAAMPMPLITALHDHVLSINDGKFSAAGIGRGNRFTRSKFVRTDEICWIEGNSEAGRDWLQWAQSLQTYLNRHLLLGLFSFESHFSLYSPGDYYKRHKDAFKGEANRVLSLVLYLNPGWTAHDGGELVLYPSDAETESQNLPALLAAGLPTETKVTPLMGTLVLFLSEDFPHEVLPATRDRYAIAGWYRVNTSVSDRVDPPR